MFWKFHLRVLTPHWDYNAYLVYGLTFGLLIREFPKFLYSLSGKVEGSIFGVSAELVKGFVSGFAERGLAQQRLKVPSKGSAKKSFHAPYQACSLFAVSYT